MPQGDVFLYLVLLALCVLLSAFFSGSEAAFLTVRRLRLRQLAQKGSPRAREVLQRVEHPEHFLPAILLGNTLVNTAAAALGTAAAIAFFQSQERAVIAATVGVTALLLVLGETVPKTLAVRHAERAVFLLERPLQWIEFLLFPLAAILRGVARGVTRLFGGTVARLRITEQEIRALITAGREAGTVEHHEAELLVSVFRFGDQQVQEVMAPRTEVVWVEKGTTLREFLDLYVRYPHPRFPVHGGETDNVTGVLLVMDVLGAIGRNQMGEHDDVTALSRPPFFTPETKPVSQLVRELREAGSTLAVVVDEFGGVAGVVTLEQLVEEVVGPLTEESLREEAGFVALDDHTFELNGGLRIEEANKKLSLNLPQGEYDTVAGFVLDSLGRIPTEGASFRYDDLVVTVIQVQGVRVKKIRVLRTAPAQPRRPG